LPGQGHQRCGTGLGRGRLRHDGHRRTLPLCAYSRTSISDRRAAGWTRKYLLRVPAAVPPASYNYAGRELRRAESTWRKLFHQYQRTGKRGPASVWNAARNRVLQAQQNAVQIRRETDVTEVTLTYSGIGQPQHITAPRLTIPVSELG
jgi:hypothetical protein